MATGKVVHAILDIYAVHYAVHKHPEVRRWLKCQPREGPDP